MKFRFGTLLLLSTQALQADILSLNDLSHLSLSTVASGKETRVDRSASVVSVITSEEIEEMGALNLDDALASVPGLYIAREQTASASMYYFRGITSQNNQEVKVLIDGIDIYNWVYGNQGTVSRDLPVSNIHRIEVLRGAASALHGADAYAGLIMITTKRAKDLPRDQIGFSVGTQDTYRVHYEKAYESEDFSMSFLFDAYATGGDELTVLRDSQTNLDDQTGTNVSFSPGHTNYRSKSYSFVTNFDSEEVSATFLYNKLTDYELGIGINDSLDPYGRYGAQKIGLNVNYSPNLLKFSNNQTRLQVSYFYNDMKSEKDPFLLPPGSILPTSSGNQLFVDGMIGNPEFETKNLSFDVHNTLDINNHHISSGFGWYYSDVYKVNESKNFNLDFSPKPFVQDVSDTVEVFLPERSRTNFHAYLQDEVTINEHVSLTTGARYDYYNDFGSSFNPRIALVYYPDRFLTVKALYGTAFTTPSLVKSSIRNNPVNIGNPNLKAEEIDTYELSMYYQMTDNLTYNLSIFHYQIDEFFTINETTTLLENGGSFDGYGYEFEADYKANGYGIKLNNSYVRIENNETNKDRGGAPNHKAYIRNYFTLSDNLSANVQFNWHGKVKRGSEDERQAMDSQSYVDFNIKLKNLFNTEASSTFIAQNVFKESVTVPSVEVSAASIPNDYPYNGRSFHLKIDSPL